MRERTWKARIEKLLREEMAQPLLWHYCSFADEVFLGAVIIEGHGAIDIATKTGALGINPGGQMICAPIPLEYLPDERYRNRLLSKADVLEFWPDSKSVKEWEQTGVSIK